jgi:hypothetical protein
MTLNPEASSNLSPVLILAYKRPDMLEGLLNNLPRDRRIYIHVDGAINADYSDVQETKRIASQFKAERPSDSIMLLFQASNLGNLGSFESALQWVFSDEDRLILLEDDIRFHDLLFPFMDWSLEQYKNSNRIFHINGLSIINSFPGRNRLFESYSCRPWGFGTWKKSWELYKRTEPIKDPKNLFSLPIFTGVKLTDTFKNKWLDRFTRLKNGTDTYDLSWNYAAWVNNCCALAPRFTFTTNIGFDSRALHTRIKPVFLRFGQKFKTQKLNFYDAHVVPFPSYYDAYSDFLEWGVPGISKGSVRFFIQIYHLAKKIKRFVVPLYSFSKKTEQ